MDELKHVHFRPLVNGNFVLDAYDRLGYHIERELRYVEISINMLTQYYLDIKFKNGTKYRIWFRDIDFSRVSVPLYVSGYRVHANYFHALYAVVAEVSYYASGFSEKINRDYLMGTKELAKFYVNQDVEIIIKTLLQAAGVEEKDSPDLIK